MFLTVLLISLAFAAANEDAASEEDAGSVEKCTMKELENCDTYFNPEIFQDIDGAFPKKEFLDKHCGPLQETRKCSLDVLQKCPDLETPVGRHLIEEMLDLVNSICDEESEIRKGYLENVECYEGTTFQVFICAVSVVALTEDFVERTENLTDFHHPLLQHCVGFPILKDCIIDEVTSVCGSDETRPLAHILQRFTDLMMEGSCPEDLAPIWNAKFTEYMEEEKRRKK